MILRNYIYFLYYDYLGKFCEIELSARVCDNNPCRNNGTCKLLSGAKNYECNCAPGIFFNIFYIYNYKIYILI